MEEVTIWESSFLRKSVSSSCHSNQISIKQMGRGRGGGVMDASNNCLLLAAIPFPSEEVPKPLEEKAVL